MAHPFYWVGAWHGGVGCPARVDRGAGGTAQYGLIYMLLFGIKSMIGMAALSSMIAVTPVMSARLLTSFNQALQLVVGSVAMGIGATAIYSTALAG